MAKILVVDDKEMMRDSVATILGRRGHTVATAPGGEAALDRIAEKRPDAVVTDLQMPGMSGLDLLAAIRKIDEDLPVVFMTAYGSVETAVEAMREGAFDYITKPFGGDELAISVERAIEHGRLRRENEVLRAAAGTPVAAASGTTMVGDGPRMAAVRHRLERIADSHGTVLVTGESGTGKEVAARWIHDASPRREGPFLAINCAALSASLLESELFGHEKGAFTGADKLRKGRFELADGGTLLLDEISEIPPELQAKLLRVLQERTFERVGSSRSLTVDVRVIATTNRNLATEVDAGRFRGDLYFRLNVLPVEMPALRERPEDLAALADHFLAAVGKREGRPARRFSPAALDVLRGYVWPGNVRELQNICERAAVLAADGEISAELVAPWLPTTATRIMPNGETVARTAGVGVGLGGSSVESKPAAGAGETDVATTVQHWLACDGALTLADIERETIVATLKRNRGHRQRSAKALGIGVRTLGLKLMKWKEEQVVEQDL
jgi:DNA-binding NtrC family response regulator